LAIQAVPHLWAITGKTKIIMKCLACDKILNDREASRKSISTGEHLDLCDWCFEPVRDDIPSTVNVRLDSSEFETTVTTPHQKQPRYQESEE